MPHTELLRVSASRPPTVWQRLRATGLALRSSWSGPLTSRSPELAALWAGEAVSSGVTVTEATALTYSAVWAAVQLISGQVAALPLFLYKRNPKGGKDRMTGHPLYRLLHDEPNPETSSLVFRETLMAHVLLWGNRYAEIQRDPLGRPTALWTLTPDRVGVRRNERGQIDYLVRRQSGKEDVVTSDRMLHVPGLGWDGLVGYSVVGKMRESLGLSIAAEKFGSTFFGNSATMGGVVSYPGPKPAEASVKNTQEVLDARHHGVTRAHRMLTLFNGAKYERMGIPPNDAQFLETRKFQVEEIARWFDLAPYKLRRTESTASYASIEQQSIEHLTDCLMPWLVRCEQEYNRKLVLPLERTIQFTEHLVDGILRGDQASRYAAYAVGRNWGWLSVNDIRERENMNPIPDGDIYLVPTNMAPADKIDELVDSQIKAKQQPPTPAAPPDAPPADDKAARAVAELQAQIDALTTRANEHLAEATAADAEIVRLKQEALDIAESLRQANGITEVAVAHMKDESTRAEQEHAALVAHQEATAQQQIAVIGAHRALMVDAVSRMLRREIDRIRTRAQSPDKLRAWMDTFYAGHVDICRAAFLPAIRTHLAWQQSTEDPVVVTAVYVQQHIDESKRQLEAVLDSASEDYAQTLETTFRRWELERADAVADVILRNEIDHMRTQ